MDNARRRRMDLSPIKTQIETAPDDRRMDLSPIKTQTPDDRRMDLSAIKL